MKKSILFISLVTLCTLLITACGGKKAQGENVNSDSVSITNERQQYRFVHQFIKANNEEYDSIVVKGYKDSEVVFECRHQLIDYVSEENAVGMGWINDTMDINFDGIPDLQVFRGYYTRGQVAELYAAYVWTQQKRFEEVKQWEELYNPQIHPDNKTITENYRSDLNIRTFNTYKWTEDNQLELINTKKGTFFGDDPREQEMVAVMTFVEDFYNEWDKRDLLDYNFVKQHITPNLLKYLANAYDYECEGECLATWKFFYEGGGDVGESKSYAFTPRDERHVLVEHKYENYEYDVLLTVVKDGETFKIDSLLQVRSEYLN